MKKLRDILIVAVLGCVVVWVVGHFVSDVHSGYVEESPIVTRAEFACIDDGVCATGVGYFASEEEAQAYFQSPEHLAAEKVREAKADQEKADADLTARAKALAAQGLGKVRVACLKDGTLNCDLIDKETAESISESILRDRDKKNKHL